MVKGYIKTVEAVLALLIIAIVMLMTQMQSLEMEKIPSVVKEAQNIMIRLIEEDNEIRSCIINNPFCENSSLIAAPIEDNMPLGYNYSLRICDSTSCDVETPVKSVYVFDMLIGPSSLEEEPKIVRIWMWKK